MNRTREFAAAIAAIALGAALACSGGPPSDDQVRAQLDRHRGALDVMCAAFPALPVLLVGRKPGIATLAWGSERLFERPTDAQLVASGIDRATFDRWGERLAAVGALQVEREGPSTGAPGVAFVVDLRGLSVSGSETTLFCGTQPPAPAVPRSDDYGGTGDGFQCALLAAPGESGAGWWVCRMWG